MYYENMNKNGEKTKLGWVVPKKVREAFTDFCNLKGTVIQEECAGALIIYQYLPAEIREQARLSAKGLAEVDEKFWRDFAAGLELAIQAQQAIPSKRPVKKK